MSELVTQPNPMSMIALALEKGADVATLEKFMDLQERWNSQEAEKAFAVAMNKCQADMPTVIRDKKNGQTGKLYAPVETIKTTVKKTYSDNGFSLSFTSEPGTAPGLTTVHLDVIHVGGHTKRTTLPNVPLDDKGPKGNDVKTQVQGLMSSMSYAQGRLICLAFNITVADEDRDGQGSTITADQIERINTFFDECERVSAANKVPQANWEKYKEWFNKWLRVESIDELTIPQYSMAIAELNRKIEEIKK